MRKTYSFESKIYASEVGKGGVYIVFPYDIREGFGVGGVKVQTTFDNVPYEDSIVNMGVKNLDGSVCCIPGLRKDIRKNIGRDTGDIVVVTIKQK